MAINDKTASFGLARTNPKISGNVKITVDSAGDVWLNTINASKELSSADFKRFRVTKTSTYQGDLKRFIGKLPPEVVFKVKEGADPTATSGSFKDQYDLFYAMGAAPLISDAYSEDNSYFAPLWIRDSLPDYFVIFRIEEPLDFPYNDPVADGDLIAGKEYKVTGDLVITHTGDPYVGGETFTAITANYTTVSGTGTVILLDENKDLPIDHAALFEDLVKKSEIIETFDLGEDTAIGSYIRRIKNDERFPIAPMTARFDEGLLTTWNGVAYQSGAMTSKGERLERYWESAQTQIEFEQFITQGFERQGIICPFLLNLEFLFDDETADMYSVPRYFGLYVNKKEIGSFQLDGQKLFDNRSTSGNTPAPKRANKGFKYQNESFFQNNPDGVRLFYQDPDGIIPTSDFFDPPNFENRFYWIQDKLGKFHSLDKLDQDYGTTETDLVVRDESIDLGTLAGPFDLRVQGKGLLLEDNGRSYLTIKVEDELYPNDRIRIYWNIGNQTDINGTYDEITANDLRRYFTIAPGGLTVSIFGDVSSLYASGDQIGIQYAPRNRVTRTITSVPVFGGTYTTFDIDSPVNNTAAEGYIEIESNWGPGSHLASEIYVPIYFHPYGTPSEVAQAIAGAFNALEQRTFDCIAIDDTVVVRMRGGQLVTNQFFGMFPAMTDYTRLMVMDRDLSLDPFGRYYFEGGTDRNNIRVRVGYDELERLSENDIYIKTDRGYSKVVHTGLYMDDPIEEVGGDDFVGLNGWGEYGVATIEDPLHTPSLGSTKEYLAYSLYRVPVGVFSMYNVKDIDGDFLSSTYGRSPVHEFKRYFNLPADQDVLVLGREYLVFGDDAADEVEHDGSTYVTGTTFVASDTSFTVTNGNPFVVAKLFFARSIEEGEPMIAGQTVEVLGDPTTDSVTFYNASGTPVAPVVPAGATRFVAADGEYYTVDTPPTVTDPGVLTGMDLAVVDTAALTVNNADAELKSFPGFSKFQDFLSIEEENQDKSTVAFKLNDKYFFNEIATEYEYLKENYNKDLSTTSRLQQWVAKWVYKGGLDVRDNPYRLNTSPVFGPYNFAPSYDLKTQNPEGFTHEWYYLEGRPHQYVADWDGDNYYFFPDDLDLALLTDADPSSSDYFSEYFTIQPTTTSKHQERYSVFDYNREIGLSEAFFRGAKIRIKESIKDTRDPALRTVKPPFKENSTRFDGYRFTALLRTRKEERAIVESPVELQVIENKTDKTITFLVDVVTQDYRTLDIIDPAAQGQWTSPVVLNPDMLDTKLDYTLLYSLKSKKNEALFNDSSDFLTKGLDVHQIGDTKLSVALDLSAPSGPFGTDMRVFTFDNPTYDWDMRDEIHAFRPQIITGGDHVNAMYGQYQYGLTQFDGPTSSEETNVRFDLGATFEAPVGNPISVPFGSDYEWEGFAAYQRTGGVRWYEPIMQRVSFARIAEKVNEYSPYVRYRSFEWDGVNTQEVEAKFYLEFVKPSIVNKKTSLIPLVDDDKPEELQNEIAIGSTLTEVNSAQRIARYSGPYEPKFRNLFFFENQVSDSLLGSPSVDLSFLQATFNPSVPGFGKLKNFGYLKVADQDILTLVNNPAYESRYPLLDETAIDYLDFPVYQSSWDPGFWRKFTNKKTYRPQAGTREMKEPKNFLATKVMKTPRTVQLETFLTEEVADLTAVNVDTFAGEVVYQTTTGENSTAVKKISGYVNVAERLRRYLREDGADGVFEQYLVSEFGVGDPEDINDDISAYLTLNVLPTYEVKEVLPYVRLYKQNSLSLPAVEGSLDDVAKVSNGYVPLKNFSATKVRGFVYRFDYDVDASNYASIALSLGVGKI